MNQSVVIIWSLLIVKNKSIYAALICLIESAIWIVIVSQVIKNIDDPLLILAYATCFSAITILLAKDLERMEMA